MNIFAYKRSESTFNLFEFDYKTDAKVSQVYDLNEIIPGHILKLWRINFQIKHGDHSKTERLMVWLNL